MGICYTEAVLLLGFWHVYAQYMGLVAGSSICERHKIRVRFVSFIHLWR